MWVDEKYLGYAQSKGFDDKKIKKDITKKTMGRVMAILKIKLSAKNIVRD